LHLHCRKLGKIKSTTEALKSPVFYENSIMKHTKQFERGARRKEGDYGNIMG
jgi:hypothetical protein